jgi:ABC-2 type transport system permease protein
MSSHQAISATPPSPLVAQSSSDLRVTTRRVIRGEWIKLRSVRSTVITIAASMFAMVFFGVVFSATAGSGDARGPAVNLNDPVDLALSASTLVVLIVGVVGALFTASDYSTGLIKTTLASTGSRLEVLAAKAAVIAPTIFVTTLIASVVAFVAGQAAYTGDQMTVALSDPDAMRALIGTATYHMGIAVMGVALGFILRSTAGAIGTIVVMVFISPALIGLLPDSIADSALKVLPSEVGASMKAMEPTANQLSPGSAFAVFAIWVLGSLAVATWQLRRQDA